MQRFLRRAREPVIVFTEFRDTLTGLAGALGADHSFAIVHGAQAAEERRRALEDFSRGAARLLLATDAASEGLNLHERCRTVVSVELPWNPNRLEQRVGRVDRIGQRRPVHALHLVGLGTSEERLWHRIEVRQRAIRSALDDTSRGDATWDLEDALRDVPGPWRTTGAAVGTAPPNRSSPAVPIQAAHPPGCRPGPGFPTDPVAHLTMLRGIGVRRVDAPSRNQRRNRRARPPWRLRNERPHYTTLVLRGAGSWRGTSVLAVYRVALLPEHHGAVELTLVPVALRLSDRSCRVAPSAIARLLTEQRDAIQQMVRRAVEERRLLVWSLLERVERLDERRLQAIERDRRRRLASGLVQPSLFARPAAASDDRWPATTPVSPEPQTPRPMLVSVRLALAAVVRAGR